MIQRPGFQAPGRPWTTKERFVSRPVLTSHRGRGKKLANNSVAVQAYGASFRR